VADNSSFRQNHDLMRAAATRKVQGPASKDTLAASGGLERPDAPEERPRTAVREPIPGEREPNTLLGTQPGAVGGVGFGANLPATDFEKTMDERTAHEHQVEGGGADSQRS
jgi:hypothetical protein